jgi:hypothetical protein
MASLIIMNKIHSSFIDRDNPENGPSFGADSLVIPLGKDKPRVARSKLGSYCKD